VVLASTRLRTPALTLSSSKREIVGKNIKRGGAKRQTVRRDKTM
jgi:hypothetical protein